MVWSEKQIATLQAPFDHCLEVNEGTPRSSKTTAGVFRFARHLIESHDINHLVAAFNQEQAYKLVMECDGFGLLHIFAGCCKIKHDDNGDHLEVITPNGMKKVYYKGGGKADSHKAITGVSLGSVYFCEINLLHINFIQECFRRTFAATDRWHLADLNPPAPHDPVIKNVFEVQDTKWQHWTIDDNPIITPERKEEIRKTLIKNPYLYKRDWLGERCIPEGVIYSNFTYEDNILPSIPNDAYVVEMFFSGDGGLTDATSVACNLIVKRNNRFEMYRVAHWYYDGGNKAMSTQAREIAQEFAPYCRQKFGRRETTWKIDPACKALRKELELFGILTDKADNNNKDIKGTTKGLRVGIEYAQSCIDKKIFALVENDKYGHCDFLREISMYCVDNSGNPVDAYNHSMDDFRYSVNYFYKHYVLPY